MATHLSILAWRIPWTEDLAVYSPRGRRELDTTERLHSLYFLSFSFVFLVCEIRLIKPTLPSDKS